jgi:small GTP-binding protein
MSIYDVGGQDRIRKLWHHYYESTDALIFVLDSADEARIGEAASELAKLHRDVSLRNIPFLIFANKQDLPTSIPVDKLELGLAEMYQRNWKLQACSALTGEGVYEGLDWLREQMLLTKK